MPIGFKERGIVFDSVLLIIYIVCMTLYVFVYVWVYVSFVYSNSRFYIELHLFITIYHISKGAVLVH